MGSHSSEKSSGLLKGHFSAKEVCGRGGKSPQLSQVALLWSEVQDDFCLFLALLLSILNEKMLLKGEPSIMQGTDML